MSSADKFATASGSNSNDAFDDLDLESSRRLKRQALLQKRNEEMERRCAERKEKELELQRRRKEKQQQQQQEEQSWQQQLLMSRDLHRKSSEGYNNTDDNDTKKSASSSALSPPLSPNLLGPTPPPTPPKTAPKTARTSNRNSRTERDSNDHHLSHLKSLSSTLSSSSLENRASDANNNVTTTKAPSSPILKNNRNGNHRYNDSPSNTPSPNKVAFRDGTNIKSRYNNGSSYNVSNDKYASSSPPNSMSRKNSKSSYSQLAKKSQIRKRHWQIESDSDDDDEKISFEELARLRRRREKQLSQNSLTAPPAPLQATASTKMSQLTETTNVEEPQKTECTKEQKAAKTVANNNIRWSRYKVDDSSSSEDDLQALRRKFHASKKAKEKDALTQSTVSTNHTNHKQGHTNNNLPFSHLYAASRSSQQQHSQNLKPKPRVLQLTQASSSESDDPEKELIESTKALRAKLQAQQEAKYKHNPVAMAKREEREWNERKVVGTTATAKAATVFEGLVGAEIVVRQSEDANDDGNANGNDGKPRHGDKWKQSRRHSSSNRHFRNNDQNNGEENAISSPGSPLEDTASNKNQCARQLFATRENNGEVDELWDDSDENEGKNNDSESEDDGKGRNKSGGRRGRGSNTSSNQRKRALSQNRSSNGTARSGSPQTKKQISSAKANGRRSTSVDALVQPSDEMDTRDPSRKCAKSCKSISRAASARAEEEAEDEPLSDEEEQRRELKPDFRDPKLGKPSALVPLLLSRTWTHSSNNMAGENSDELEDSDDEKANEKKSALRKDNGDVHQVPASINRYLKEYQREGVQFMYSSVIRGEGCVLGDDMGLGKTVQLISLIAALLKKTGTGMDALEIHRHRRKVTQAMEERQKKETHALMTGVYSGAAQSLSALDGITIPKFSPILIVVPSSVIQNWVNEFKVWGHFNVAVYQGQSRENQIERVKSGLDFILVTGKSLFTRGADFENFLGVDWKLVIVDEFHEYKNPKSQAHQSLVSISTHAQCPVIGMTGTLMQNNHEELFHLIDLARPSLLGDKKSFIEYTARPIKYARAKDAKDDVKQLGKKREQELMHAIKPAYLERKKNVVLKDTLTKKNEKVIFCELSEIQKKLYRHIITLPDYYLLKTMNGPCDCGANQQYFRGYAKLKTKKEQVAYQRRHKHELIPRKSCCYQYPYNPNFDENNETGEPEIDPDAILWIQKHQRVITDPSLIKEKTFDGKYVTCPNCPSCTLLAAMSKLYKVCSHPSLVQVDNYEVGRDAEKKLEFAKIALPPDILSELPGGSYYKADGIMNNHLKLSGKMRTLDYCLNNYQRKGDRVLVFSNSVATLDLIQQHIKTKGYTNLRLDGSTQTSARQTLVDKFQNDDSIFMFLISTKAGGLGLNLTAANKVIIFDVNWNPSLDEQAQDRSFRIGQKNDVEVVRLVARGTIEELMYARQVYKVQLKKQTFGSLVKDGKNQPQIFRGVAEDKNRKGELFGIENLLSFKDGSFMDKVWKKSVNPRESHDASKIAEEFVNAGQDELEIGVGVDDEINIDLQTSKTKIASDHTEEDRPPMNNEDNDDDSETANQGFNHDDYFQEDRGGARIAEGEDGYEEEMGGESQIFQVTTKLACQDLDIESSDDEIAQSEALMVVSKIPSLSTIKETASPRNNESEGIIDLAVPSPVCSSSVFPREDSNDAESKDGDECAQGLHNETDNVGAYVEYSNPLKTQDQETFLDASENKKSQLKGNTEISSAICRLMNVSNGAEEQSKSSLNPPLSADIESREMKECGKYSILCQTNDSPDSCELQGGNDSSAHQQNSKTDKQATKSTPVKKASIPMQNAPSKFSLMGVVFENSNKKKKKLPATKKAGLYIPSYAKGKNS